MKYKKKSIKMTRNREKKKQKEKRRIAEPNSKITLKKRTESSKYIIILWMVSSKYLYLFI